MSRFISHIYHLNSAFSDVDREGRTSRASAILVFNLFLLIQMDWSDDCDKVHGAVLLKASSFQYLAYSDDFTWYHVCVHCAGTISERLTYTALLLYLLPVVYLVYMQSCGVVLYSLPLISACLWVQWDDCVYLFCYRLLLYFNILTVFFYCDALSCWTVVHYGLWYLLFVAFNMLHGVVSRDCWCWPRFSEHLVYFHCILYQCLLLCVCVLLLLELTN